MNDPNFMIINKKSKMKSRETTKVNKVPPLRTMNRVFTASMVQKPMGV